MMKKARGFTYLIMLFFVAITAAALAALGQSWSSSAQREREAELEFRGKEIARAIASYVQASPNSLAKQYPRSLQDLLVDRRGIKTWHHLRRLYPDPFTGEPDWVLTPLPNDKDRFIGVHSRSDHALLRAGKDDGKAPAKARDWAFVAPVLSGEPEVPGAAASAPQP